MSQVLWTIGHSTRPIDEFVVLLKVHGIQRLIDVQTVPRSRDNPQFNTEALTHSLPALPSAIGMRSSRGPKKT